jgi:hypothetical protein
LSRAVQHMFTGVGSGIAGTVYGTVVAMATLTAAYATEKDPWRLAVLVFTASLVLWIAHVYAHALAESLEERRRPTFGTAWAVSRREVGILAAALPPVTMLVLGALGVVRESAAVWLALSVGLAALAAEGFRVARFDRMGPGGTLVVVGLNLALGVLVVLLKVSVAH